MFLSTRSGPEREIGLEERTTSMLVLSRKRKEVIVIRDDIFITVMEIRRDKVRLGVDAPQEVPVHRREVYEAILREARQSCLSSKW